MLKKERHFDRVMVIFRFRSKNFACAYTQLGKG